MDHRLLLIKDGNCSIRDLTDALCHRGYTVATASEFEIAVDPAFAENFDLILIDHCEPRISAVDVCTELRERNIEVPVVVLVARDHLGSRIPIFKAGADECLLKPVDVDELQLRIEVLLIRSDRGKRQEISMYEFGGMRFDFHQSELMRNGSKVELSQRETRLLRYLVENRGKTISRSALLQHVWGYRQAPLTRTVDVHILRLRNKIEEDPKDPRFIVTIHGFGYRFDG